MRNVAYAKLRNEIIIALIIWCSNYTMVFFIHSFTSSPTLLCIFFHFLHFTYKKNFTPAAFSPWSSFAATVFFSSTHCCVFSLLNITLHPKRKFIHTSVRFPFCYRPALQCLFSGPHSLLRTQHNSPCAIPYTIHHVRSPCFHRLLRTQVLFLPVYNPLNMESTLIPNIYHRFLCNLIKTYMP